MVKMLILALTMVGPATALAQDAPPPAEDPAMLRAKELYDNGTRLYEEGLYSEAIGAFEEAYRLSNRPLLMFNIANAYERLGKLQEAVDYLNKYRAFAAAEDRESLERRISALDRRLAEQKAAAAAAPPVVIAPPVIVAPVEPAKKGLRSVPLAAIGGTTVVVFGAVSGLTYVQGRTLAANHDEAAYTALRPLNNAAIGLSVVGAGLLIYGVLPGKSASDLALAPSFTSSGAGLIAAARF